MRFRQNTGNVCHHMKNKQRIDCPWPAWLPLALFFATPLFGQFETGEVLGTIRDQQNQVVPRAAVYASQ